MKRRLVVFSLATLLVLGIGITSVSASGTSEGSTGGAAQAKTVKLLVWDHTPQFEAPLAATLKNFMSKNPNIEVSYEIKTPEQYYSLLQTAIQAGEAPDLFWTNGTATEHLGNFIKQGAVMDLTGKLDLKPYPKLALAMVTVGGKIYAVPGATIGTRAVYYNKDIFKKYNLNEPKTFGDFEKILETLKQKSDLIPMSLGGRFSWSLLFHFEPILAALHPDWITDAEQGKATPNDPRVIDALNTMIDWGKKGYYGDGYLGMNEGAQLLAFSRGQAAMTQTGSWNASSLQKNNPEMNIGAFQIPTKDGREPMVVTFNVLYSVYSKSPEKDAAVKLAQYFASMESQQIWVDKLNDVPGLPGLKTNDPLIGAIVSNDFQVNSFYYLLGLNAKANADPPPTRVWDEDIVNVVAGEISPQKFVESLAAEMKPAE